MSDRITRAESLEFSEISFIAPEPVRPVLDGHKASGTGSVPPSNDGSISAAHASNSNSHSSSPSASHDDSSKSFGGGNGGGSNSSINQCTKCGADKIAKSRAKGLDSLVIRFLPRRPYRCLRCYHRFWNAEPFTADKRRIWSWVVLLAFVALFVAVKSTTKSPVSETASTAEQPQAVNPSAASLEVPGTAADTTAGDIVNDAQFNQPTQPAPVNVPMSKVELEQRLQAARIKSDNVKRINQQKQTALAAQTSGEPAEVQALLRTEINYRIEQWRKAWQAGDANSYLSYYSQGFQPQGGISYASWRAQRQARVVPEKNIVLVLSEFAVEFANDNSKSVVTFNQRYVSNNFWEDTRKELVLSKQAEQWYIISEREIDG